MIAVGETKVQVLIGGSGSPLLVLHGAGGNRGWRRWMDVVGERHTIYAPTHPGFGRSDSADWMEGIEDLARFYLWFMDVAGLGKVALLGHSIGGWTAAEMATMRPEGVERLVLVAPTGLNPEWAELYGSKPTPEELDIAMRNREMTARLTWKPYMFNPRLSHFLPRASMPALIVWGREDRIVPVICGE